jgi:hypothetical protein
MKVAAQGYPRVRACALVSQAGTRRWVTRVGRAHRSEFRQHAGQDLQAQIFFVAQSVGPTLDDADLVVEAFDEAERDLVLRLAVGGDAVPMSIDHLGEFLVGFQALPLSRSSRATSSSL